MRGKDEPHPAAAGGAARALAVLTRLTPTAPVVYAAAAAAAAAQITDPTKATGKAAFLIPLLAVALGACALVPHEPVHVASAAPEFPGADASASRNEGGGEPVGPEPGGEVVMPRSSEHALVWCALAFAGACAAQMIEPTASATRSIGQLAVLVGAAGSLALAGVGLLHAAAARHSPAEADPPPGAGAAPSGAEPGSRVGTPAGSLSTASLCRAWRRSYLALRTATTTRARAELAAQRGEYLDELAGRDPAGFHRWISSDPYPVAGHPEQFIDHAAPARRDHRIHHRPRNRDLHRGGRG